MRLIEVTVIPTRKKRIEVAVEPAFWQRFLELQLNPDSSTNNKQTEKSAIGYVG